MVSEQRCNANIEETKPVAVQSSNIIAHQLDENYTSARHQSRNHDGEIIIHIYNIKARDQMILNLSVAT